MLKGNKAIVTGGSRGIGYAVAKALAEKGASVVITGRNEESLKKAAKEMGKNVYPLVWDVSCVELAEEKISEAARILGGLDIVVNNAGIFAKSDEWSKEGLLKTSVSDWEDVMKTNTSSVFFTMQAAVRYMLENKIKGNILNITSASAYEPATGAYGTSKTAATALTRGWGKMFARDGITINGIAPGPVATEMNNWHEGDPIEHPYVPYGRFALSEEIAQTAVYLLSKEAEMICGETLVVDGAYSVR